jgi:hypothetical protein
VTTLSAYLKGGSVAGTQDVEGVLYAFSGGAPAALLAVTQPLAFASTNPPAWYELSFASAPPVTSGATYCIGLITGGPTAGAAAYFYDVSAAPVRFANANAFTSGPTNPFGSAVQDVYDESVYATLGS